MTAPELKPCPFCGGDAVALTGPVKTLWGVTCLRCACWRDDRADTADEAIAAWNRRAALEPQPDPRDEVIARLVEALDRIGRGPEDAGCFCGACVQVRSARTALAAAKAVQHG